MKNYFDDLVSEVFAENSDELLDNYLKEYKSMHQNEDKHIFSDKFYNSIDDLIYTKRKSFITVGKKRFTKKAITILLSLAAASAVLTTTVYAFSSGFIVNIFNDHSDITVSETSGESDFGDDYSLGVIPDGFSLSDSEDYGDYKEKVYEKDTSQITLRQWKKDIYQISVDTETNELKDVIINGFEGKMIYFNPDYFICWQTDTAVVELWFTESDSISFEEDEVIEIAKTVKSDNQNE